MGEVNEKRNILKKGAKSADTGGKAPVAEGKEEDVMDNRKVVVVSKDVPEEVQSLVTDLCIGVDNLDDVITNSKTVKDKLDKQFNGEWNVIMGRNFAGCCSIAKGFFLQMKIGSMLILVFKSAAIAKAPRKSQN